MHHTVDEIPNKDNKKKKYIWQKSHLENLTGTSESYKPKKLKKNNVDKKYDTWKK